MGDNRSADASKSRASRAPSLGKGLCDATTGAPPSFLVESNISDSFPAVLLLPFVYPAEKLLSICHRTPPSALPPGRAGVRAVPSLLPRRCRRADEAGPPAKLAGPALDPRPPKSPTALSYEVLRRWCPGRSSPPHEPRTLALPPSREPPCEPPAKEASTSAMPAAALGGPLPAFWRLGAFFRGLATYSGKVSAPLPPLGASASSSSASELTTCIASDASARKQSMSHTTPGARAKCARVTSRQASAIHRTSPVSPADG